MLVMFMIGNEIIEERNLDPTELPREREGVILSNIKGERPTVYYVESLGRSYPDNADPYATVHLSEDLPNPYIRKPKWVNMGSEILVNFDQVAALQVEHPATLAMYGAGGGLLSRADFGSEEKLREAMTQLMGDDPRLDPLPSKNVVLEVIDGDDPVDS